MYAAHFAAGLAIGSRAARAPMWALLIGCFLPDLVWIVLAVAGVEPTDPPAAFFDDWSHSLLSILVEAGVFALFFRHRGIRVWGPIWLAVASHFPLDVLIHPKPIALYPHSALHAPWDLWHWGATRTMPVFTHYWWVQLAVMLPLLAIYGIGARRQSLALNLIAATLLLVIGLHLLF